jgi:hypothetical protein
MSGPTKAGRYGDRGYIVERSGEKQIPEGELIEARDLRRGVALELARFWLRSGWSVVVKKATTPASKTETLARASAGEKRLSWMH